jgi:hypothetical protein
MLVQPQDSLNGGSEKANEKHQKTPSEQLSRLDRVVSSLVAAMANQVTCGVESGDDNRAYTRQCKERPNGAE